MFAAAQSLIGEAMLRTSNRGKRRSHRHLATRRPSAPPVGIYGFYRGFRDLAPALFNPEAGTAAKSGGPTARGASLERRVVG